ncbi:MAG TPA: hypothetical protein VLH16_02770 [Bacteroidales bacterium]|nr:hypothetical protein [Bacteroidales bacterium]
MKKTLNILRFYFRYKITWRDMDFSQRRRLIFLCRFNKMVARNLVFYRTLNNVAPISRDVAPFDFIGFTPWFTTDSGFNYSAEYNEVD